MDNPLPIPHCEGVVLGDFQIVHHGDAYDTLPDGDDANTTVGSLDVHSYLDRNHRQEALFNRQERVLLVGVDDFALAVGDAL